MVSSLSMLSSNSIVLLFGPTNGAATPSETAQPGPLGQATGHTDDVFKAGKAIGNIIAIVAGMKEKGAESPTLFTMDDATRIDAADGGYTLTKAGTGLGTTNSYDPLKGARTRAEGTGAQALEAHAFITAYTEGTIEQFDMSQFGVTSTMTLWEKYDANGAHIGEGGSTSIAGMDQFYRDFIDMSGGVGIFKPTGQYFGISQNGTVMTLNLWGEKKVSSAA